MGEAGEGREAGAGAKGLEPHTGNPDSTRQINGSEAIQIPGSILSSTNSRDLLRTANGLFCQIRPLKPKRKTQHQLLHTIIIIS